MRVIPALLLCAGIAHAEPSPVGLWSSPADQVAPAREILVTESGGVLTGRIVRDDASRETICFKCDDDRKGQPILGMDVLRGAKHDGENWLGGQWLEPQTGTLYRTRLTLAEGGQTLTMRGTVGLALMGRSQVWTRLADDAALSAPPAAVSEPALPDAGPIVFVGAQGPAREGPVATNFAAQARAVWANLDARLGAAGLSRDALRSVTIMLADRADVAEERIIRAEMLGARTVAVTIIVTGMPERSWLLQISAEAVR